MRGEIGGDGADGLLGRGHARDVGALGAEHLGEQRHRGLAADPRPRRDRASWMALEPVADRVLPRGIRGACTKRGADAREHARAGGIATHACSRLCSA